jgi:hypothetical protein
MWHQSSAGDWQTDVDDGFRARLETFVEQTFNKAPWINCARWMQPAGCFREYVCMQGVAKAPGTAAAHMIITGHWNGSPDFPETIRGDLQVGPPLRMDSIICCGFHVLEEADIYFAVVSAPLLLMNPLRAIQHNLGVELFGVVKLDVTTDVLSHTPPHPPPPHARHYRGLTLRPVPAGGSLRRWLRDCKDHADSAP